MIYAACCAIRGIAEHGSDCEGYMRPISIHAPGRS
jgi:hypothetical protein